MMLNMVVTDSSLCPFFLHLIMNTNIASLLIPLLLLLIVIYDGVGKYNETIILDWYVDDDDDDVEFVIMSVHILSHKDNYYTFIPSSYSFIGGDDD